MKFKDGDRVIRTLPDGRVQRGVVKEIPNYTNKSLIIKSIQRNMNDLSHYWTINDKYTNIDVQYYREERLKQLLG